MTRDELLCAQIREALYRDKRIFAEWIAVDSRAGIVTLRGSSPSYGGILAAVLVAASFPRCRGVVNRQVLGHMRDIARKQASTSAPLGRTAAGLGGRPQVTACDEGGARCVSQSRLWKYLE